MSENINGMVDEWEGVPLTTFTPNPNEAIVVHFNFNDGDLNTMVSVLKKLERTFPDNPIVMIPDRASLESCDKDTLRRWINIIEEVIENL